MSILLFYCLSEIADLQIKRVIGIFDMLFLFTLSWTTGNKNQIWNSEWPGLKHDGEQESSPYRIVRLTALEFFSEESRTRPRRVPIRRKHDFFFGKIRLIWRSKGPMSRFFPQWWPCPWSGAENGDFLCDSFNKYQPLRMCSRLSEFKHRNEENEPNK